jgi:hypothetical protein
MPINISDDVLNTISDFIDIVTDNTFNSGIGFVDIISDKLYTPRVYEPVYDAQFNQGSVTIKWKINNPLGVDSLPENVTYELEYTDNYNGYKTNWFSIKKRIKYDTDSFVWTVGKMIKSDSVRVRLRAVDSFKNINSGWSISSEFSVNVFKIIPPAIVSPVPGKIYSNFINIILDDTITKNTFNQKVRYTYEYSSFSRNIDWTVIKSNIPFGENYYRWDISALQPSDDYVLRLTIKNSSTSCLENQVTESDQISRIYVSKINIQSGGIFIIDTVPPVGLIEFESSNNQITNQLNQILNIYSYDETTDIEQMQIRECEASSILSLGDLEDPYNPAVECPSVENSDLSTFGHSIPFSPKVYWSLSDKSGLKKIETLFTDYGGNSSIQSKIKVFLNIFDSVDSINDFEIIVEQRDKIILNDNASITIEPRIFEVLYLVTESGELWSLEPFAKKLYSVEDPIKKIIEFNNLIYFSSYNSSSDICKFYRNDYYSGTVLYTFDSDLSYPSSLCVFNNNLYLGFINGQLWKFNGTSFSLAYTFGESINSLDSDSEYLYIGFKNSKTIYLYNNSMFFNIQL